MSQFRSVIGLSAQSRQHGCKRAEPCKAGKYRRPQGANAAGRSLKGKPEVAKPPSRAFGPYRRAAWADDGISVSTRRRNRLAPGALALGKWRALLKRSYCLEGPAGLDENRQVARRGLVAADGHVDIERVQLHASAHPAGLLAGDEGRAGTEERIDDHVAAIGEVEK